MARNGIQFKVGASLDSNIGAVFVPLEKAAEKSRAKIQASLGAALGGGGNPYRSSAKGVTDAFDKAGGSSKKMARITGQSIDDIKRQLKAFSKAAQGGLDISKYAEAANRELARVEKQAARARLGFAGGGGGGLGFGGGGTIGIGRRAGIRVGRGAAALYGYGGAALSGVLGAGESILRGIGVNTDVSSMISSGVDQQALAQKIINSAPEYNKAGIGERRAAAADTLKSIQGVANDTATDTGEALEALEAFVAKTGELKTGKDVMGDLAKLSRATGTNLADMANAAAEVSLNVGDVPNKAKVVYDTMRAIAGQGKLGAVEIKDLASQMAKVATQAGKFEGDRGKNIAVLGAMAQVAKSHGGAASAAQATTSVQSFVANLTTGATLKHWSARGLSPYTDASKTTLRSPEEIILEAMKKTKGNLPELRQLFTSSQSMRVAAGYADIYRQAGGGQAGLEAIDKSFKEFANSAMTTADVQNAFAAQMDQTKSQVQVFNNQMAQVAQELAGDVMPAFKALAPVVVSLTKDFASALEDLLGKKQPREQQEAIDTEFTSIEDRDKVRRSIKVDPKTGQMTMPEEGQKLLEGDAAKLQEKIKRQKEIVAEDQVHASGLGERFGKAHGIIDTLATPAVWLGDVVSGKQSAAKDKERIDQGELKSLEANRDKTNNLLGDIKTLLQGPLKFEAPNNTPPPKPTPGSTMPAESPEPQ